MNAHALLAELKNIPTLITATQYQEQQARSCGFSYLKEGLPQGALVEVSGAEGSGKTEVILRFLAENPTLQAAWIESDFTINPCAFLESHVALERVLFIDASPGAQIGQTQNQDPHWIAQQILSSQVFNVLILSGVRSDERTLRRLQLAAQRSQTTVIFLNRITTQQNAWPFQVQLEVHRSILTGHAEVEVLRYKGQQTWMLKSGSRA